MDEIAKAISRNRSLYVYYKLESVFCSDVPIKHATECPPLLRRSKH